MFHKRRLRTRGSEVNGAGYTPACGYFHNGFFLLEADRQAKSLDEVFDVPVESEVLFVDVPLKKKFLPIGSLDREARCLHSISSKLKLSVAWQIRRRMRAGGST